MITHARFTVLFVTDQQKALDFWTNQVGFELQLDAPYDESGKQRWIEIKAPKGETYFVLDLVDAERHKEIGSLGHVWFSCDDLDATFNELKDKGVEFTVEPSDAPWAPGTQWAQFKDPDGNLYGLSQG